MYVLVNSRQATGGASISNQSPKREFQHHRAPPSDKPTGQQATNLSAGFLLCPGFAPFLGDNEIGDRIPLKKLPLSPALLASLNYLIPSCSYASPLLSCIIYPESNPLSYRSISHPSTPEESQIEQTRTTKMAKTNPCAAILLVIVTILCMPSPPFPSPFIPPPPFPHFPFPLLPPCPPPHHN